MSGPGFCFGGSQALELSMRRPTAGTVVLYGSSIDGLQEPRASPTPPKEGTEIECFLVPGVPPKKG